MAPNKGDFDLTDRGWVDLYVKKCENIMKEFTDYVYGKFLVKNYLKKYQSLLQIIVFIALQSHCLKEHSRIVELDNNCKELQIKLVEEKRKQQSQYEKRSTLFTPLDRSPINNDILGVTTPTKGDADGITIRDGSPAFLNMAMVSEQLNMESSCVLSPAQHRQEIVPASEQLSSPNHFSITIDSVLQHNTSPTCKLRSNNENQSALGFIKARGRVGKTVYNDSYEHKLREQNIASSEVDRKLFKQKGKLKSKCSDWLEKDKKSEERRASLKRSASNMDEVLRKRSMMTLNKSGERKLRQSRLTQMVSMKSNKVPNVSDTCLTTIFIYVFAMFINFYFLTNSTAFQLLQKMWVMHKNLHFRQQHLLPPPQHKKSWLFKHFPMIRMIYSNLAAMMMMCRMLRNQTLTM